MVDWVHHHPAHVRATPTPARTSSFAARHIHVIDISYLANRGEAVLVKAPDFTRGQLHQRIAVFEVIQYCLLPGAARDLSATARSQLDIVDVRAKRNRAERQRVSHLRRNIPPGDHCRSDTKPIRREYVAELAVRVFDESNTCRTVGVVLDPDHFCSSTTFAPLEIDLAIFLFVAAADMP